MARRCGHNRSAKFERVRFRLVQRGAATFALLFVVLLAALVMFAPFAQGQTVQVKQFPGATVGDKLTNAQTLGCSSDTNVTCVLVIAPEMSVFAAGTMPSPCSRCTWQDWRPVGGSGRVVYASSYPLTNAGLQAAVDAAGVQGKVIIDASYTGLTSITFKRLQAIECRGPSTNPIVFANTTGTSMSIASANSSDYLLIRNCNFTGSGSANDTKGFDFTDAGIIYFENVSVKLFGVGIFGSNTLSFECWQCNVSGNATNYKLTAASNSWRIFGGISSQAVTRAVDISSNSNQTYIGAVRFESNALAIYNAGDGTTVTGCRFESNDNTNDAAAVNLSLLGNYYSTSTWTFNEWTTVTRVEGGYPLKAPGKTVSTLPACAASSAGAWSYVTDSTAISAEGQTCVGSSSTKAMAFCNGTNWKCF